LGDSALKGDGSTTTGYLPNFCTASMDTNLTIMVKFFSDRNSLGYMLTSGTGTNWSSYLNDFAYGGSASGGAVRWGSSSNLASGYNLLTDVGPHWFVIRFDGFWLDCWLDGKKNQASFNQGNTYHSQFAGNLYLWNLCTIPATGDDCAIGEVDVWTNVLTDSQINSLFGDKFRPVRKVHILGDSISASALADPWRSFGQLLKTAVPETEVFVHAWSGWTSTMGLDDMITNVVPTLNAGDLVIAEFGANDMFQVPSNTVSWTQNMGVLESNLTAICQFSHSNYCKVLLWTAISQSRETNGWSDYYNGWIRSNWQAVADGYVDPALNTTYGIDGSYANTNLFPDLLHPNSTVYANMVTNYFAAGIKSLLYPAPLPANVLTTNSAFPASSWVVPAQVAFMGMGAASNAVPIWYHGSTTFSNILTGYLCWTNNGIPYMIPCSTNIISY